MVKSKPKADFDFTAQEKMLNDMQEDDVEVEAIKAKSKGK